MSTKVICIDPIEGYLTKGKEYDFVKIESYAGRAVIAEDDRGLEGHYKADRFMFADSNVNLQEVGSV